MKNKTKKYYYIKLNREKRKNKKRKAKQKKNNLKKYNSKNTQQSRQKRGNWKVKKRIDRRSINVGRFFSFFKHSVNVINLINKLENLKNDFKNKPLIITIDLSEVVEIDIAAISVLLAKINDFKGNNRILIYGTYPKDSKCKQTLVESGLLEYIQGVSKSSQQKKRDNFIVSFGQDETKNEIIGKSVKKAVKYLSGVEKHYHPVYSILMEMCSNSVEHSNEKRHERNWFLGVNFDTKNNNKYVQFILTDMGDGILKTLKRKYITMIKEEFRDISDDTILKRAFEKKYGSKTKESNRNKGLPLILDKIDKKHINNMVVITNKVLLNFQNENQNEILNKNFPGTFYSWEIDLNTINYGQRRN